MSAPEAITRDELAEALSGLPLFIGDDDRVRLSAVRPADLAEMLLARACAHREPEYRPGEVYLDKLGGKYIRTSDPKYPWLRIEQSGEVARQFEGVPQRPLRKLVAMGSQAAALSFEDVHEAVNLGVRYGETPIQIAGRVCKLLEGES